jgi:hypothetical protein
MYISLDNGHLSPRSLHNTPYIIHQSSFCLQGDSALELEEPRARVWRTCGILTSATATRGDDSAFESLTRRDDDDRIDALCMQGNGSRTPATLANNLHIEAHLRLISAAPSRLLRVNLDCAGKFLVSYLFATRVHPFEARCRIW